MIEAILIILIGLFWHNKKKKSHPDFDFDNCVMKLVNTDNNSITIKENSVDISRIKEYTGNTFKQFEFRPQKFTQFIGQEEAKERAKTIIKKARRGIKAHLLVKGIQGHGKTVYIEIIAKELGAKLIKRIGKQVNEDDIINIINEINEAKEDYIMLFIDETDTMDWKILKIFNPIIESFELAGKKIRPFIFAGATINKHKLLKTNPDTLDRIPHHIDFARYNGSEIIQIIQQYKNQLYPDTNIDYKILNIISQNCKYNPRIAILSLLEDYIVEKDIEKVLKNHKIIKDGLTETDIKILQVLKDSKRAKGANALAMASKLSEKEYTIEYEPYLYEENLIDRIPQRVITEKGKELLANL